MNDEFDALLRAVRACRLCRDAPRYGGPLPHEPRPVVQAAPRARLCIIGQAPGARVHASGRPYTDASGQRLRGWLGLDENQFYDDRFVAVVPMGFCFPGNDSKGGDLPPRRECSETWHAKVFERLRQVEMTILVGQYAQRFHLERSLTRSGVTETVRRWRDIYDTNDAVRIIPLPHPSWRNTGWLKRHAWFETDLLPVLRADIARMFSLHALPD